MKKKLDLFCSPFDHIPLPIFESDNSDIKKYLDKLEIEGDIETYLDKNPNIFLECIERIKILNINDAAKKFARAKKIEDFILNLQNLFTENSYKAFKYILAAIVLGKTSLEVETSVLDLDGRRHDIVFNWQVHPDHIADYSKLAVSIFDITELKKLRNNLEQKVKDRTYELERINQKLKNEINSYIQTEIDLKKSKKRFQDIALSFGDLIWEVDSEGIYTYASSNMKKILGYDPEEIVGKSPFDFLANEAECAREVFRDIVLNKQPIVNLEHWNLTKEKEKVCLLTNSVPILDENNNVLGYRGLDKNITENKRAEEALKKSEEQYKTLADFACDWEYWIGTEGNFVYVSPSCERITGYPPEDFINDPSLFFKILHPDSDSIFQKNFYKYENQMLEFCIIKANGEKCWLEHLCQPVYGSDGRFSGLRSSNRDITKRKQTENDLIESEKQISLHQQQLKGLKHLNSMGELASSLAHQLSQPLTIVSSYAQECIRKAKSMEYKVPEECLDILEKIEHHANQAGMIIHNLRKFFSMKELQQNPEDINKVIEDTISFLKYDSFDLNFISFEFDKSLPLISFDKIQIEQIILNIVQNAIEAMKDMKNARIIIKTCMNNDMVTVDIIDTGPGMSERILNNIFDPFFTTKHDEMSGMGLAICRSIIEAHNGHIEAFSEEDNGSRVQFSLPI